MAPLSSDKPFENGLFSEAELYRYEEDHKDRWSVPWSDLMMVMFVLFVVLFAYAGPDKDMGALFSEPAPAPTELEAEPSPLARLVSGVAGLVAPSVGGNTVVYEKAREIVYKSDDSGVTVVMEPDGSVRMTLSGSAFFSHASPTINPSSKDYLREVAELMRMSNHMVHIIGHADSSEAESPVSGGGLALSASRAASVADYFIQQAGFESERFIISGRGANQPEKPNTSIKNVYSNRRVEIVILTDNHVIPAGG